MSERVKNPHAVALAKRRAAVLSPERRREISRLGAIATNKLRAARKALAEATKPE